MYHLYFCLIFVLSISKTRKFSGSSKQASQKHLNDSCHNCIYIFYNKIEKTFTVIDNIFLQWLCKWNITYTIWGEGRRGEGSKAANVCGISAAVVLHHLVVDFSRCVSIFSCVKKLGFIQYNSSLFNFFLSFSSVQGAQLLTAAKGLSNLKVKHREGVACLYVSECWKTLWSFSWKGINSIV